MKKKLSCWNVNGIRACVKKGFVDWVRKEKPDFICLQETKFQHHSESEIPDDIKKLKGYSQYYFSGLKKGYSGVAIYTKEKPIKVFLGINEKKFDNEGRVLTLEFSKFYLTNAYFPNGGEENKRVPFKLQFCKKYHAFIKKLEKKKPVIICGDFNTAHEEIDLARPKQNQETTGFLPIERKWMSDFIKSGYVDTFRHLHPDQKNHYTWWSYRMNARAKNVGWRLDYFFVSQKLESKIHKVYHRTNVHGSDHCPVILEMNF